jgi:hypothetical protein
MVNPVSSPSGSGSPTPTSSAGVSDPPSSGSSSNAVISSDFADLFREIDSLASTINAGSSTGSSSTSSTGSAPSSTPTLTPPSVSLLSLLGTLNTTKSNLSEAIQASGTGDASVLQALYQQYLSLGDPAGLIQSSISGSSTQQSADFTSSLNSFQDWLNTLNTKENSAASNNPLLSLVSYLLPDSANPGINQNFTTNNAAQPSGGGLALSAGTQTMTGATYFQALIRALFKEVMQNKMLTDSTEASSEQNIAAEAKTTEGGGVTTPTSTNSTTPTQGTAAEPPSSSNIEQALTLLITQASVLSNKPALSLLNDANNATLQNQNILEATKATAVLSTLISLLRPESIAKASTEIASAFGINLQGLSPSDQQTTNTRLAQFLQQALGKSGLTAFFQAIQGIYNKNTGQNQTLALNNRLSTLSSVLNGAPVTEQTLADTLKRFQTISQGTLTGPGVTNATKQLLGQSLQEAKTEPSAASGLAQALTQGITGLFSQSTAVTATQIQQTLANVLNNPTLNPNQVTLNSQQQNALTNRILSLASSVTTQQDTQAALIQNGAATAASRFSAQLSQVLYGFSVNLLNGTVTPSNVSTSTPSAAALAATSSFNAANKVNVDLGTFLLKLMEPANVTLQLANPVMYAGPESNIAGDRNLVRPNAGP